MITRAQNVAVVMTCLLAALTNAGAVTPFALVVFVLPAVMVAAVLGSFLAARRASAIALILGGLLALGWSELVNVWSGTANGPAARATFVAAGCTLVAVVVARSSSPALFLLTVAASVCGALLLGAGGEVRGVAVAAAVSAALTLGWIEQSRRNWTARPRRAPALVLLSLLVGAVAAGVVLLQAQRDPRQPEALAAGQNYPHIKPPWSDPLGRAANSVSPPPQPRETARQPPPQSPKHQTKSHPRTSKKPSTARTHTPPPKHAAHGKHTSPSRVWLYVLAGILLVALALAARLLAVRLAWRRLRLRLASGAPAEQVTGAWAWMRMRLEACRLPLPAALSPDVVAAGGVMEDLPTETSGRLGFLATTTTLAAFASEGSVAPADGTAAWNAAGQVEAAVRGLLTRRSRTRLAFRGPASTVRSH